MEPNLRTCDFCKSTNLRDAYPVPDSALGMVVQICMDCGLVQSHQTKPKPQVRLVSTSSGAGWGNIRHGKGLRLKSAVPLIKAAKGWDEVRSVLDVGSNRGDFIHWLLSEKPDAQITAVEPDLEVVATYKNLPSVRLIGDRFENVNLPSGTFDFVYLSHTLEHAASASAMLKKIYDLLQPNGVVFLEVPNLAVIDDEDVFEEFFIDKHTFHFSREILRDYLTLIGYEIFSGALDTDRYNITFHLRKTVNQPLSGFSAQISGDLAIERMMAYEKKLTNNREKLKKAAEKLVSLMDRQKVAFWGAGRQFDALVRFGGLDPSSVKFLVDEHLWKYLPQTHSIPVHRPEELKVFMPQVVVVMARGSADEITEKVRRYSIKNVIKLRDLLV